MMKTCLEYHQETSYDRFDMSGHSLDWANQPKVFKEYPGITSLSLPRERQIPKGKLSRFSFYCLTPTRQERATRRVISFSGALLLPERYILPRFTWQHAM